MSTSSLAVARGLEALWLGGLFTAAELAAADLLLQLSVQGGGDEAEAASSRSTTTTTSSPRWSVSTLCEVAVVEEEEEQELEQAVEMAMELDRRATKRYRLLSELYAATTPPSSTGAVKKKKKKKRRRGEDEDDVPGSPWPEDAAARYGEYYY